MCVCPLFTQRARDAPTVLDDVYVLSPVSSSFGIFLESLNTRLLFSMVVRQHSQLCCRCKKWVRSESPSGEDQASPVANKASPVSNACSFALEQGGF